MAFEAMMESIDAVPGSLPSLPASSGPAATSLSPSAASLAQVAAASPAPVTAPRLFPPQQRVVRGVEGEKDDITWFLDPVMPLAGPVPLDADGWARIDGLSAVKCVLNIFHPMEDVPQPLKEKWGRAVAEVLRRLEEVTTEL